MRPIDADNLISVLDILSDKGGDIRYWEQLKQIVADCPTADVVEVVRCKDCKHRYGYKCDYDDRPVGRGDYCSRGERMDEVSE